VETPAGGAYDLGAANRRERFRDDANDAADEVDHGRERVLAARAEAAADGRWLGGKRPSGWQLDRNPCDADGNPRLFDDGNPVRGILRVRQDEADALARAHRDVLDGATIAGIARDWNTQSILTRPGHGGAAGTSHGCCAGMYEHEQAAREGTRAAAGLPVQGGCPAGMWPGTRRRWMISSRAW
jgi:hypothetical protein